jgi:hypothetical protein
MSKNANWIKGYGVREKQNRDETKKIFHPIYSIRWNLYHILEGISGDFCTTSLSPAPWALGRFLEFM